MSRHLSVTVAGNGVAGYTCAARLAEQGVAVTLIGPGLPCDRPPLSKRALITGRAPYLAGPEALKAAGITHLDGWASAVDLHRRELRFTPRTGLGPRAAGFDTLVWATGLHPWLPPVPGIEAAHQNADPAGFAALLRLLARPGRRVVVLGAGLIGTETAAMLSRTHPPRNPGRRPRCAHLRLLPGRRHHNRVGRGGELRPAKTHSQCRRARVTGRAQKGEAVMKEPWSIAMLISGALFIAGVFPIAWERAPAWRAANEATFRAELAYTLQRVDRLQPALLVVCLVSSVGFAVAASGTARILAAVAAACILAVLAGSGVRQVPIQRRLTDARSDLTAADVDRLRARWLAGHLVRTVVALAAFAVLAVAASV